MGDDLDRTSDEFELTTEFKHRIKTAMLQLSLTLLLAEVGRMQGPPDKAQAFINKFRDDLYRFADEANREQRPIDKAWDKEMRKFVDETVAVISFKEGEP